MLSLGTCFAASHWSSRAIHLTAPGMVWFADLEGAARREMETLAQADWTQFLKQRARELHTEGHMVVGTLGSVPDPTEINGIAASGRGIYRALYRVAQDMADDGILGQKHVDEFLFALWFMTEDEAHRALTADQYLAQAFEVLDLSVRPASVRPDDIFENVLHDSNKYARSTSATFVLLAIRPCEHSFGPARAIMDEDDLVRMVREQARPGDMVVYLGAGSISAWANALPARLGR